MKWRSPAKGLSSVKEVIPTLLPCYTQNKYSWSTSVYKTTTAYCKMWFQTVLENSWEYLELTGQINISNTNQLSWAINWANRCSLNLNLFLDLEIFAQILQKRETWLMVILLGLNAYLLSHLPFHKFWTINVSDWILRFPFPRRLNSLEFSSIVSMGSISVAICASYVTQLHWRHLNMWSSCQLTIDNWGCFISTWRG